MRFKGVELCCPQCKGDLHAIDQGEALECLECRRRFPVLLGIPDLRIFGDAYYSIEKDRANARALAETCADLDFESAVDLYYRQAQVTPHQAYQFKQGLMRGSARAEAALNQWEVTTDQGDHLDQRKQQSQRGMLLEVGCGTAQLLVIAARHYTHVVGIDIALRWLVIAQRYLADAGLDLPLICACAEALPFPDNTFDRVIADAVFEHLQDQPQALAESYRVLRPRGYLFAATPNRYSLGPDPHAGIWAGGMLPERWIAAYIRRQGGNPPQRRLLSYRSLRHLVREAGFAASQIYLPDIPARQRQQVGPMLSQLITLYQVTKRLPGGRQLFQWIGPLLHMVAQKPIAA